MSQFKLNQYPLVSDNYWQVGLVWTILFKSLGSPTKFHSSPENSWNTFIHQMSCNRVSTLTRQEILILSFKLSICSNHSLRGLCHSSCSLIWRCFTSCFPNLPHIRLVRLVCLCARWLLFSLHCSCVFEALVWITVLLKEKIISK